MSFRFGQALGRDFGLADLERDYDAAFLAPGLGSGRKLSLPGLGRAKATDALSLLQRFREQDEVDVGRSVVVIGGGSVAADAALSLRRAGAERVTVVCLEGEDEMPALASEVAEMRSCGIAIENGWGPSSLSSTSALSFARCTRVFDQTGAFRPSLDESETLQLGFDQLIMAIGQTLEPSLGRHLEQALGLKAPVPVDPETLQVAGRPALFAGGDVIREGGTVAAAVADGRRAAQAIDRRLRSS